jgi:hypothetical protein
MKVSHLLHLLYHRHLRRGGGSQRRVRRVQLGSQFGVVAQQLRLHVVVAPAAARAQLALAFQRPVALRLHLGENFRAKVRVKVTARMMLG